MVDALPIVRGTLDLLVLRALAWTPMHSFEILSWLEQQSSGGLELDDSALYQALSRLEGRGLISAEWGVTENNRRGRYYALTAAGRRHFVEERNHWERLSRAIDLVLKAELS